MRVKYLVLLVVSLLSPSWARAGVAKSDVELAIAGRTVVQRGSVAAKGKAKVPLGKSTTTVTDVARLAFVEQDKFTSEAKRGRKALLNEPVVVDEFVELADATIVSRTTKMIVTDPVALRKASPTFAKLRSGNAGKMTVGELPAAQRDGFARLKAEILTYPDDHPLKQAAKKNDQALLDAIGAGFGEFAVTTTMEFPKKQRETQHVGSFQSAFPSTVGGTSDTRRTWTAPPAAAIEASGTCTHDVQFMAGYLKVYDWKWTSRFDIPGGYFRFHAHAWFDFGIRIPIELHVEQTPNKLHGTGGERDIPANYAVSLTATTLDAGSDFYTGVGLKTADVHEGNEVFLSTGVELTMTVVVQETEVFQQTIPANAGFNWGQNFQPPFGNCGSACGPEFWIPATATHTVFDLGIVTGSAQAGFRLAGDGTINVDYEALANGAPIESWTDTNKATRTSKATLAFQSKAKALKRTSEVAALKAQGDTPISYGYRLSNPRYTWDLELVPGIKGTVAVKFWPIKETIVIGPFWLDVLALKLGTLAFAPYPGAQSIAESSHGTKSWSLGTVSGKGAKRDVDSGTAADAGNGVTNPTGGSDKPKRDAATGPPAGTPTGSTAPPTKRDPTQSGPANNPTEPSRPRGKGTSPSGPPAGTPAETNPPPGKRDSAKPRKR